jgi:hypothetical protein
VIECLPPLSANVESDAFPLLSGTVPRSAEPSKN